MKYYHVWYRKPGTEKWYHKEFKIYSQALSSYKDYIAHGFESQIKEGIE